jgi:protocatechuate 3,4-dioxygenase, alpha subunit
VRRPGSLHRDGYTFTGWGRTGTDNVGHYSFTTLEPTRSEPGRPTFIAMTVFARGLLDRLFTRVYLPDPAAVAADPFLASLPADRRATLVARREDDGSLGFDVRLQGEHETVFLAFGG